MGKKRDKAAQKEGAQDAIPFKDIDADTVAFLVAPEVHICDPARRLPPLLRHCRQLQHNAVHCMKGLRPTSLVQWIIDVIKCLVTGATHVLCSPKHLPTPITRTMCTHLLPFPPASTEHIHVLLRVLGACPPCLQGHPRPCSSRQDPHHPALPADLAEEDRG